MMTLNVKQVEASGATTRARTNRRPAAMCRSTGTYPARIGRRSATDTPGNHRKARGWLDPLGSKQELKRLFST